MNIEEVILEENLQELWVNLRELHFSLRKITHSKYKRTNPFIEDLFDWKEKGNFWNGKDVTVYDSTTIVGDVRIGDHTWIGPFCSLDGSGGLTIGNYCAISAGVQILTHDTVKWALSGGKVGYQYDPVKIGNGCFLGCHAIITKGVNIGDHCLIGAGAVVTKDVPDNSVVAGVPAKIIGTVKIIKDGNVMLEYFR